jgi:hypothetical protein
MPAGRQLGLLWGAAAAMTVGLGLFADRIAAVLPACPIRAWTGVPCPACGAGGAALALARFDPVAAFAASPLAALVWIAFIAGGLAAGVAALAGREVPEPPARLSRTAIAMVLAIAVANWAYLFLSRAF